MKDETMDEVCTQWGSYVTFVVRYDNTTILNRKFPETNLALGTKVHVAFHFQITAEEFLHSSARHKVSAF